MEKTTIEQNLLDLNKMVIAGKLLEAFDKYYHDDVKMQENDLAPTEGKQVNRQREEQFLSDVTEFRKAKVEGIGIGARTSYVIWSYDYTHKDWGARNYTQVSIQQWQDGLIIHERFLYDN